MGTGARTIGLLFHMWIPEEHTALRQAQGERFCVVLLPSFALSLSKHERHN
jgi:hypothetical protein